MRIRYVYTSHYTHRGYSSNFYVTYYICLILYYLICLWQIIYFIIIYFIERAIRYMSNNDHINNPFLYARKINIYSCDYDKSPLIWNK